MFVTEVALMMSHFFPACIFVSVGYLDAFLDACSCEEFFRTTSQLLKNPRLELLSLEKWMQVVQQEPEVVFSVSVGDDDGRFVPRHTVRRPVASTAHHQWIFPLNLRQSEP